VGYRSLWQARNRIRSWNHWIYLKTPSFTITAEKDEYVLGEEVRISITCPDKGKDSKQLRYQLKNDEDPEGKGHLECNVENIIETTIPNDTGKYTYTLSETVNNVGIFDEVSWTVFSPECQTGEYGLIIRNCELGFEITRANNDWAKTSEITPLISQHVIPESYDANYRVGVILEKQDQGTVSVNAVESINPLAEHSFEKFVQKYYLAKKLFFPDFTVKPPFFVARSAIIEMEKIDNPYPQKLIIKIEFHNENFYIFTTSFRTDKPNVDDFLLEQNKVNNSFDYLDWVSNKPTSFL